MTKPVFIDNLNGNTMARALRELLASNRDAPSMAGGSVKADEARIATAYFSPTGFARIASTVESFTSIKLMLGVDPLEKLQRWHKSLGESDHYFLQRKISEGCRQQEDSLRASRDHLPFTRNIKRSLRSLVKVLREGNMQVRRYEKNFLHAKVYILTFAQQSQEEKQEAVIAGSSNLTAAGLSTNLEVNLGRYDKPTVARARTWFDELWADARPFDLAAYFEDLFEPKTPFAIFLKVLWELYGDEIEKEVESDGNLPLTTFQKHGVVRALRLIDETGGVIVADEVGLGKTFIAAEILARYKDRRQRSLLLCPAALRDTLWKKFMDDHQLYMEVLSFEQLAIDLKDRDAEHRPTANRKHLASDIDEYQLVIIDEAHNYRNPDSPSRAVALRSFLYGKRKDVLMLTATPVNNSLWDLYHLTQFFLKQDSFLASKGILSIRERFNHAMKNNPNDLSPDVLFPIVDATTVKRTRHFIKKHYSDDQIKLPDGTKHTIVFPEPQAISVRYEMTDLISHLFDMIEHYLDPEDHHCLTFARYKTNSYRIDPDGEAKHSADSAAGFLASLLLKRFESSLSAFSISIKRLIVQHEIFLDALDSGYVIHTRFFREVADLEDEDFDSLLIDSDHSEPISSFNADELRNDATNDLRKLRRLADAMQKFMHRNDPKLQILERELVKIATQAKEEAKSREDEINKRKVLIFSFFADSARWIRDFLAEAVENNPILVGYKNRLDMIVGSGRGDNCDKALAARKFAPQTAGNQGDPDLTDILVSTDVLAEGVNLQQARHIINYDLPWNPMKLVQRHGRIDRIGSKHRKVFLRTIFPGQRLDRLLGLEERIVKKIAMASVSVGIVSPIAEVESSERVYSETREEIDRLQKEDPSLYERGGTASSMQSGEEYRQTLRKALQESREEILNIPWKAGSGMRRGPEQGMFFCAKVGKVIFLRFVHTDSGWQPRSKINTATGPKEYLIDGEWGRCLRLIECAEDEAIFLEERAQDAVYDLWPIAQKNIHQHWMSKTDPKNLQPGIRSLNFKVAEFIRENVPEDDKQRQALNILESPWLRRYENHLRSWFKNYDSLTANEKGLKLIENIIGTGLEVPVHPKPLLPIEEKDIELLVWLAVAKLEQNKDTP